MAANITVNFKSIPTVYKIPSTKIVPMSWGQLIWSAAVVGRSPLVRVSPRRPLLELAWRTSMLCASLRATAGSWVRSDSFLALDPSEKTAVNYFAGMAQAHLVADTCFRVPWLVHYDVWRAAMPATVTAPLPPARPAGSRRRPDFVGVGGAPGVFLVEAKGRTHKPTPSFIADAKVQIDTVASRLAFAATKLVSVSYFDSTGAWSGYVEDPPGEGDDAPSEAENAIRGAHYEHLVAAVLAAEESPSLQEDLDCFMISLPAVNASIGVPRRIVDLLSSSVREEQGPLEKARVYQEVNEYITQSAISWGDLRQDDSGVYRGGDGIVVVTEP